ncbi:hypothetical protein ACFWXK_15480 [Streptomyces sp. NPDC059070]|uniref:hypothetical protein n=1 Tax=Streptomyces sp. NPDC059070 TaxID=3346713 RepID=UPI0036CD46AB
MKGIRKAATVAAFTGATVLGLGMPAQAAEGTWEVNPWGICPIYQQVQLQGSPAHDWMRWYTPGNASGCDVWIINQNDTQRAQMSISDNAPHSSGWYYDGPGYRLQVCVNSPNGHLECGPEN